MNQKIYSVIAFAFLFAFLPSSAGAIMNTGSTTASSTKPYPGAIQDLNKKRMEAIKDVRKDVREDIKDKQEVKREEIKTMRDDFKNASTTSTNTRKDLRGDVKDVREEFRGNMKDAREEARGNIKDIREEFRGKVGEVKMARIQGYIERTLRRLEAAFGRLDSLSDRITSRITKLEEVNTNINTVEAKRLLSVAETKISDGKNLLTGLPAQFNVIFASTTASSTVPAKLEALKDSIQNVTNAAKAAHAALIDAVASIKAQTGSTTPPITSTSTATTTTN